MKVLVLADEQQKEELLAFPVDDSIDLEWITGPKLTFRHTHPDACIDLLFENTTERINWLKRLNASVVIINSVIDTISESQPEFIRLNGWNTFLKRQVVEAAGTDAASKLKTETLFAFFSRTIEWVPDIPGFITPRIISSIINEAYFALEEQISTPGEIDTAMKLGTNYPFGPFEWGKKIGLTKVYALLNVLGQKQARYQPSLLLKQTALA